MSAHDVPAAVRVEVLGPLRLLVDGQPVEVRGPKRRAVLALLALAEGRTVTVDHLVDALWPSELPESARQAVHTHVSRLRGHLGPAAARLQTWQDGYRLALGTDDLDLSRARALLARARTCAEPASAFALLDQARRLWQGPALADLTDVEPIAAAVQGCAQLLREVTDALIACAVPAGRADAVAGLAAAEVAADPLREPVVLLRMRVLAATGHAPEALQAGREYRRRLADETGLDPSPALDELERDIAAGAVGPAPPHRDAVTAPTRPTTRLIGREVQVAALHRLLAAEQLVTLVGPGGVGKTRVALEVARGGDATVLLLAPVTDPDAIPHALAAALNLTVVQGDVLAACLGVLGARPCLLVIDNCEHLLDAVRELVGAILSACPQLSVLATSREALGLAAEYAYRLAPLPLPGTDDDLARVPSVAMFLDRAARVRPGPPASPEQLRVVADIVGRLDGMPLAIELAAGRLSTFSLTDLRDRLDRSLDLLGGGRPGPDHRHRTLRATVEWSYRLLAEDEQRLFRHLAVFVDGVDLDAAERLAADLGVAGDPGSVLARLVDTSMVDVEFAEHGTRYRMLETLRAYGLDRLAAQGEQEEATGRLVAWAVDVAAWLDATVATEQEEQADAVLRRELANLRAAWRAARAQPCIDAAATLVVALHDVCQWRDLTETWGWAEELVDDPALEGHPLAADVMGAAAEFTYLRGDSPRSARLARTGLEVASGGTGRWRCLGQLAVAELSLGAWGEAVEHAEAAAALGFRPALYLAIAGLVHTYAGDLDRARDAHERMRAAAQSPSQRGFAAYVAGEIDNAAGDVDRAQRHYAEAIAAARRTGATFLAGMASVGLVTAQAAAGEVNEALRGYRDVVDYFARTGNWTHLWVTLRNLAVLLRALGDGEPADLLIAAADRAPDAPAVDGRPRAAPGGPPVDRAEVLEVARRAIEGNLATAR